MTVFSIVPRPESVQRGDGEFPLDAATRIVAAEHLVPVAHWLQSALRPATGLALPLAQDADRAITLVRSDDLGSEAYRLDCTPSGITVAGGDPAGVFHGCQTLLQLLPPAVYRRAFVDDVQWAVPAVAIRDTPRFGWRGMMLDVARHFMPKHDLLRLIDLLAMHRLNTLHLHLTDDQGWRVEIRRYPKLTEVGSWRHESQLGADPDAGNDGRPHGGFYTQDDIREIVAYAASRFITVVPEIDVPGHTQAAIAAYPELGVSGEPREVSPRWGINVNVLNTEDTTVEFFRGVFDEIMDLFPSQYIGVGGDECPKEQWRVDERTQALIRERSLAGETELQAWFIHQIGVHISARGRRMYGWDDLLEGDLPADTVVASWRGMTGAVTAARKGYDVVSCPDDLVYLDYRQSELPDEPIPFSIPLTLADAYSFDPVPSDLGPDEAGRVLGGQANLWTENLDSPRTVDYFAFPRLCAIAEALWSNGERDFAEFEPRLEEHLHRLDALGVEYRRRTGPMPWQTRPGIPGKPSERAEWAAFIDGLVANIRPS
ncbi:beta-N-acetylhexosaminidase [Actinokineospora xionganensis]|uniref:beta-N-acetylhexosaminidase n=1 Tax=Actinokineospora xionganensis TaxID=2684470 RepID=A0ABR7L0M1_9PSEU|nr:beta-N-acetylhexosaminidase [Actinokineospora xionganensis]MBC6446028.1 beta-N-acetylhexosaminidase [Actinokineospora xionganensis]